MRMSADMPPQLFAKMAKKIAQLTKVAYTLSARVEEQEAVMLAMRELHQEDVQRITRDANDKLARCQTQAIRQVALLEQLSELEGALVRERQERCRLEVELGRRPTAGLAALCAQLRDAGLALRSKLDDFERLQLHVELALEGVPESLPLESSRALVGLEAEDCVLRKNDFLRDHCDRFAGEIALLRKSPEHLQVSLTNDSQEARPREYRLAVENSRMRNRFEDELGAVRSFYEDSLCKLRGSRRLEVANDVSLVACSCCCNDRERLHALLRLLSSSEQQLDRYCKEIRALSDDLEKREKQLKLMEDQASCRQAEMEQLVWRLKQSELALSQLRASSALDKQQANADKVALLEAVASERESRLQQFQDEAQRLASMRDEGQKLREQLAVTETAVADCHKELLAKEQKNEELVRRLNTFREESKCLKLIQAQLKESLLDSEERVAELSQALNHKTEEVNTKNGELQTLWNNVKRLKWELTEDIQEKEAMLGDLQRIHERKLFDLNTTWESKLNEVSAAQENMEAQLDKQRPSLLYSATTQSELVPKSSSEKCDFRSGQSATSPGAPPGAPPGALSPLRLGGPSLPPTGPLAPQEDFAPALPPRTARNKRSLWLLAQPADPGRATTMLRRIVENVRHPK
ncbi:uncharacterized protein LOC144156331 isoform X1 [Haemaphysalis longicornis]